MLVFAALLSPAIALIAIADPFASTCQPHAFVFDLRPDRSGSGLLAPSGGSVSSAATGTPSTAAKASSVATVTFSDVIVAPTRREAEELHTEYARHLDAAGQLALVSGWTGMDLSTLSPEDVVPFARSNAIQSTLENMTAKAPKPVLAKDLVALTATGSRAPFFYGTASDVADQMLDWVDATGIDGFNLARLSVPTTLETIVAQLVPELQSRGRFKTSSREGTFREKLGAPSSRLISSHPARMTGK